MSLNSYIRLFRENLSKLQELGYSESLKINEEIRANKQFILTVEIIFSNGSTLHIKDYIDGRYKIDRISYAYHYQDRNGKCLFRYDNATHKPPLEFREHKHKEDGTIIEAPLPDISELLDEVIQYL